MIAWLLLACAGPDGVPHTGTPSPTVTQVGDSGTGVDTEETAETGDTAPVVDSGDTEDTAPPPDPGVDVVPALPRVQVDPPRGVVDAPFTLTLSLTVDGELRYTVDGSDPATGQLYTGPIDVATTTVVRAAALYDGKVVDEQVHTWIFPADVTSQAAPAGWPSQWWVDEDGGPYPADYFLDPDVYSDARFADQFPDTFRTLPVAALTVDPDDLFGADGIHEHPRERGEDWERPASLELIGLPAAEADVGVLCGVRMQGGAARSADKTPKKSFRVVFRGDYGPTRLEHPVYPDGDVQTFNTLVLRSRYNRSWANWQDTQRNRSQYTRERFGLDTHRDVGDLAARGQHVHLFLNGLYWGVYLVEERPDAAFHSDHLGGDEALWDVINSGSVTDGDAVAWDALLAAVAEDLADPAAYAAVAAQLDLTAFVDYELVNLALGNTDWPHKNWYAARYRADGERWAFRMWDFELSMGDLSLDELDAADAGGPGEIFAALRANPEFRVLFGDRVQRHLLEPDGALSPDALAARYTGIADLVQGAMVAESARWGDHWRDDRGEDTELYTTEHWDDERARLLTSYFPGRGAIFVDRLRERDLFPAIDAPAVTVDGTALTASAEHDIYYAFGADPRAEGGTIAKTAVLYAGPVELVGDIHLRARDASGTWSALVTR